MFKQLILHVKQGFEQKTKKINLKNVVIYAIYGMMFAIENAIWAICFE